MICIAGKLPILQVGRHQVCGYNTEWIRVGLQNAAERAGQDEFPFLDDIYDSIVHYLEQKCALRLLPIGDLNQRISHMLKRIGCEHIAKALPAMAPSLTISLEEAAQQAGDNYELGFFTVLKDEIKEAKSSGAEALIFEDVKKSVCILKQKQEWDDECQGLEEEIHSYLRQLGEKPQRVAHGRRIHVPFGQPKMA